MARFTEWDVTVIYDTAQRWKKECLLEEKSLLWPSDNIWTRSNLEAFKACFIDNMDESDNDFETKFKRQLENQSVEIIQLACELLLVYFLFPLHVTGKKKKNLLTTIASWREIDIDFPPQILKALETGIGGTGPAYNTRRPFELKFIALTALSLFEKPINEREQILNNHESFRNLLDNIKQDEKPQSRHILLHLLFPERYERIASTNHKEQIAETFSGMLGESIPDDLDDQIYIIRNELQNLLDNQDLDFYREPLQICWYKTDEENSLNPLHALEIKKQIVLYGPPGTGKTFEAKEVAKQLIHRVALRKWNADKYFNNLKKVEAAVENRIRRVQFHPGYGYEDFIRGLHLVGQGQTKYKNGVLLQILEYMKADQEFSDLPFVLILDELNRADLSKVLGECFSLFEDRNQPIQLAGQDDTPVLLQLPENLYFIGTMNLIDQSLEQVDFALRRRFLWFFRGFNKESFLTISEKKWVERIQEHPKLRTWDKVKEEFEKLAKRAESLNQLISTHYLLGQQYEIGHTYFTDVVAFACQELIVNPKTRQILFNRKESAKKPVAMLWDYSLEPLINQYLAGAEQQDREKFLSQAKSIFLNGGV
jgi:5-methylcytosine-specific restriction protein B